MFERYTEKARRIIFYARYEASHMGSLSIESEHLLLGLVREDRTILTTYLEDRVSSEELRTEVSAQTVFASATSTSVDLPLSQESRQILSNAADEAMRLGHEHIGTEHLLLGMLREEGCLGARLLSQHGLSLDQARAKLRAAEAAGPHQEQGRLGAGSAYGSGSTAATIGHRFQGQSASFSVQFVDAKNLQSLFLLSSSLLIPRTGDSIVLNRDDGTLHTYRVHDVVWTFLQQPNATRVQQIVVKLAEESASDSQDQPPPA